MKKKKKTITVEELKLKIKHEKATYWMHSTPLFGLVPAQDGLTFLSAEPIIDEKIMLLFILDPTDYTAERVFDFVQVLNKRYQNLPWLAVCVYDVKYSFTKNQQFWDHFKKFQTFAATPILLDSFNEFAPWAKLSKFTKVLLMNKGVTKSEYTFEKNAAETFLTIETKLQETLRENDPGLPLPLLYEYEMDSAVDSQKPDFSDIEFKGHWVNSPDTSTMTEDYSAVMSIPFHGKNFRFIACLHSQARESTSRVTVTFNDKPVPNTCLAGALEVDNQGATSFEISRFQGVYDLISTKVAIQGTLQLHFKNAANSPIIYFNSKISE